MEPQVNEKPKLKNRFVMFFHNMKDLFNEEDLGENNATLEETFPEEDIDTLKALENCQKKVASYETQHQKTIDAIETMSKTTTKAPKARTSILSYPVILQPTNIMHPGRETTSVILLRYRLSRLLEG